MSSKIDSIIFDMDGTIIDTELAASLAVKNFLDECKIAYDPADLEYITGRTWESCYEYLLKRYQFPYPPAEVKSKINKAYRDALEVHLPVVPGSVEAIRSLSREFPLALVSGSYRAEILWALKKLGIEPLFQVILGAEDYERSKPQPDGFEKALKLLNKDPQNCLVFEDSAAGIESARKANTWVVAITSTNHFKQDQSKAHHHIHDLKGVDVQWVKGLSAYITQSVQ